MGFFLYFEGQEGPMHKEFRGVRGSLEGGGSAWEVSVEILYAFFGGLNSENSIRSRPGKPNQRKGPNMNFAHFCEFWRFSLGKQARFTSNFGSREPLPGKSSWTGLSLVWFARVTPDSRRLWLFPGSVRGFPPPLPFFPMRQILGFRAPGKASVPGTLGRHCLASV